MLVPWSWWTQRHGCALYAWTCCRALDAPPPASAAGLSNLDMIATAAPDLDDLTKYYESSEPLEDRMWEYVKKRGGDRLIRKILIANNGMAATKSIMSMRRWAYLELGDERALEFIVMATPEDLNANAEFVRLADEYVEVPGGSNTNNYANVKLIVDTAARLGALAASHVGAFTSIRLVSISRP